MAEETRPEAKHYQAIKNRLFLFNLVLNFVFLSVFMALGWSLALRQAVFGMGAGFFLGNALYFLVFSVAGFAVSFPLAFYEGFVLERRHALSRHSFRSWLKDDIKKAALAFFVSLVLVEGAYYFLREFPQTWWVWAAFFWFLISVLLVRIAPQVLLPLFYKYAPLEAGPLREAVLDFLRQFKVPLKDVYVLDFSKKTVKANAMVAGLGRTKRIFFSDTLIRDFSGPEVLAVLAHETGHYLSRDTFKLSLMSFGSALLSCLMADRLLAWIFPLSGLGVLSDIAGLPLLLIALMLSGLVLLPLQNGFSRFLERRADLFALRATRDPESFISLMRRLGERNFSEFLPARWIEILLYDHPALGRRIKAAAEYRNGSSS